MEGQPPDATPGPSLALAAGAHGQATAAERQATRSQGGVDVAAVIPVEKGTVAGGGGGHHQHGGHKHDGQTKQQQQRVLESSNSSNRCFSDELVLGEENNFLGTELLKRTYKGKPRSVLEGGEQRHFFGLRTAEQRVIKFECGSQR
ncbi:unnamed protein product [Miscanthus lutarioriparius]|uniref:Uncharacterized protein n=1 Tax=Miscanthus lutarioriparius TaxID=422564 RepID=A0A811RH06_9POAL|nr:unnamed protein product [Miscanthus lutarioriparius]